MPLALEIALTGALTAGALCLPPRDAHGRITRSRNAVYAFRKQTPCPATSATRGACPGYVIDHITPLKRCGDDHPANMQWQTTADARDKDRWE